MGITYLEPVSREDVLDERYDRFVHDFRTDNTEWNAKVEEKKMLDRGIILPVPQRIYDGGLEF